MKVTEENWSQMQGLIRERWGKLSNDDYQIIAGKRNRLIGKIQERYNLDREEAEKELRNWESDNK